MTSEAGPVARWRPTPLLVTAALMQVTAVVLYVIGARHQHLGALWGWLPGIVITGLTAVACRHAAATSGVGHVPARLLRSIGTVSVLVGLGTIGDARQSVVHPMRVTQQEHDPVTSLCYALALGVALWALLRLPLNVRGGRAGRSTRFVLDALTVVVTAGVFAWYFTMRAVTQGDGHRTTLPTITMAVLGLLVALALVKAAMSGLGGLDQVTVRWFGIAAAVGTIGGSLFPMLVTVPPGLSGSEIFIPATMICVALAADRQRRAAGAVTPVRRRRSFSVIPYAAVTATDGLLLFVAGDSSTTVLTVALAAVLLTGIVVVRQVGALRENGRLLARVDQNLAQLNCYQQELTHRAEHDALTDLANRSLFEKKVTDGLAAGDGRHLSLALIDLDDFKAINDRLGHAVGDALLVVVAKRLRECVRADDVVARLGGDEFGLLLPGLSQGEATDVLDRIRDALTRPVQAGGYDLLVRASIGLAEAWPGAGQQELLRRADLAMYAAKGRGKGRYAIYDAELEQHQAADAQLGAELRRALDDGQFHLVYQPIVRLPDGAWTGLETLIRWPHPERGFVGPDLFIPIAERTGLIVPLGDWILRTALRQFAEWVAEHGADTPHEIGVNVSARQLREPGFADTVRDALAESGVRPDRLVVEVTETAVFDGGVALETLQDIVRLGVKVALDDFGTGHSSLGLLRTVPADTLKVDKSFVDGIGGSSEEAVIATAMIQITDGLHLQAVAEGVETAEQAATLYRLGYRFAQGYHFSRPLTPEQVGEHLAAVTPATV